MVTEPGNIEAIAQIGFVLLLFIIGLEIDVRSLLSGGRTILVAGVLQYPITLLFGFIVVKALIIMGLAGPLADMPLAPLYIGIAIAGSSSLLVVKLFQEHFQLDTQPGRISLTVLIFQDIWAITVTLLHPSLENPELTAILFSFLGIGLLIVISLVLSRFVVSHAFGWIAKVPEMILLGAMSWCFEVVAIGVNGGAKTGLAVIVEPIGHKFDTILILDFQVHFVGLRQILCAESSQIVSVHKNCH